MCNPYSRIAIYGASYGRTEYESLQCAQPSGVKEDFERKWNKICRALRYSTVKCLDVTSKVVMWKIQFLAKTLIRWLFKAGGQNLNKNRRISEFLLSLWNFHPFSMTSWMNNPNGKTLLLLSSLKKRGNRIFKFPFFQHVPHPTQPRRSWRSVTARGNARWRRIAQHLASPANQRRECISKWFTLVVSKLLERRSLKYFN